MSDFASFWAEIPDSWILIFVSILGLCIGSFANVVIYRWPKEESIVRPRSRCPSCGKSIRWYDNWPVISWLLLRGRCRDCGAKISWRYPLVEALMGLMFALVFHFNGRQWVTLEYLVMVGGLVTASFIDIDHFLLPDVITLPGVVLGILGSLLNPERSVSASLLGVLVGGGFLWAIGAIYKTLRHQDGMGGGDIKLLAWVGAVLGWQAIPFVIIVASLSGSVLGLILAKSETRGLKTVIPFGPYLAGATILIVCGGSDWAHTYLSWFIPSL